MYKIYFYRDKRGRQPVYDYLIYRLSATLITIKIYFVHIFSHLIITYELYFDNSFTVNQRSHSILFPLRQKQL